MTRPDPPGPPPPGTPRGAPARSPGPPPLPGAPRWPAPPPGRLRAWAADLRTGARLAAGGNRAGWLRIATVAAGIGVAVAVLLLAASTGAVLAAQERRVVAAATLDTEPVPGVDPLHLRPAADRWGDREVRLIRVRAGGPRAPVPPGLDRIPGPGEQVVSPALARLLADPDNGGLRARYGARTVGTVGRPGLAGGPDELVAWVGSADLQGPATYRFGGGLLPERPLPPLLWVLLVLGVVVLLFPMFVLVAAVSRLSAAERGRRLAAIRLVGAGSGQVRRIAAGEVLAGALLGLAAGAGLFLAARRLVEWDPVGTAAAFGGVRPFAEDVVPAWPLVLLVAAGVPVLAVATTLLALRGTLIEPLGTARSLPPAPPRLGLRPLPGVAGAALLVTLDQPAPAPPWATTAQLVLGVLLLLLAVPALLPWGLHQLVRRPWSGTPALQLATGRLRLDSGPPARLVGGLAVTLTGAIALGTLLVAAQARYPAPGPVADRTAVVQGPVGGSMPAALPGTLRAVPGVTAVVEYRRIGLLGPAGTLEYVAVAPCPALRILVRLASCADGRWYAARNGPAAPGSTAAVLDTDGAPGPVTVRVPARPEPVEVRPDLLADGNTLFTTPAAVATVPARLTAPFLAADLDGAPGTLEQVRTAVVTAGWRAEVIRPYQGYDAAAEGRAFAAIRRGLWAGTLLLLAVGAAAVLVLSLQQARDARPPLAALAAAGVPRAVLARAVGWQNLLPLGLAVLLADAAGIALAVLLLPVAAVPAGVDWTTVALLDGAALLAGVVVTALALPAVGAAAAPAGLRTE